MAMRASAVSLVLGLAGCLVAPSESVDESSVPHIDPATAPEAEPPYDIGEEEVWVLMQSHLHTSARHVCANLPLETPPEGEPCYTSEGISAFLDAAVEGGARDMIITDHNNVDAWFDPAFVPRAGDDDSFYATPIRGTEWSSGDGHIGLVFSSRVVTTNHAGYEAGLIWGPGNHERIHSSEDYDRVIAATHALGGVAIINHPHLLSHGFEAATHGADAVEVGVAQNPIHDAGEIGPVSGRQAAIAWWQARLASGDRITGLAGADHHHGEGDMPLLKSPIFGVSVNLIRVDPALPDYDSALEAVANPEITIDQRGALVSDAIARGHLMVVEKAESPRVYLGADLDGDGRYHDAREGDCVRPEALPATGELTVRVRVADAGEGFLTDHYNLRVVTEQGQLFVVEVDYEDGIDDKGGHLDIDPDDPFAMTLHLPRDPSRRQYVRVELERDVLGPWNDTEVVTNPIYFGAWGQECAGSAPLY